jgi:5'-phosphate synthase pdxT subunit
MRVGVLALQGAVHAHLGALQRIGVDSCPLRRPRDLDDVDAVVIPGGESTTMSMLLSSSELLEPLRRCVADGMPIFGTCAGMIVLASEIEDGRDDQVALGAIDITVQRNGYGRQLQSFETDIALPEPRSFHAIFIRAPRVIRVGEGVEVLARHRGDPVLLRQGSVLVASFHPELTDDPSIHEIFINNVLRAGMAG